MIKIMFEQLVGLAEPQSTSSQVCAAGDLLFRQGDPTTWLFLIASGKLSLRRNTRHGDPLVLSRYRGPAIAAEASLYANRYHCDGLAETDCQIRRVSKRRFEVELRQNAEVAVEWSTYLARQVQAARVQSEILRLKTVAQRLDMWLEFSGTSTVKEAGQWKELAAELGVTPEALYRELAKRRT